MQFSNWELVLIMLFKKTIAKHWNKQKYSLE